LLVKITLCDLLLVKINLIDLLLVNTTLIDQWVVMITITLTDQLVVKITLIMFYKLVGGKDQKHCNAPLSFGNERYTNLRIITRLPV